MIALDTNILVRFVTADDPAQHGVAKRLLARLTSEDQAFVGREVALELVWVLERGYRFGRAEIVEAMEGLLRAPELHFEQADDLVVALERYRGSRRDVADLLIVAAARRAEALPLMTFDRGAAAIAGVHLLEP